VFFALVVCLTKDHMSFEFDLVLSSSGSSAICSDDIYFKKSSIYAMEEIDRTDEVKMEKNTSEAQESAVIPIVGSIPTETNIIEVNSTDVSNIASDKRNIDINPFDFKTDSELHNQINLETKESLIVDDSDSVPQEPITGKTN
jgi:hypothetical protein